MVRNYKAIKEKNDPGVFVLPIRLEAKFNFHALADTGSNINVIPYRIYEKLGREQVKPRVRTHDDEASSSRTKRTRQHKTVEEAMLLHFHHDFLLCGTSNRAAKTKYNTNLARLLPKQIYLPCIVDWKEDIFSSEAWRRAFDINKPIYTELCHEFYSTYNVDEEVTDDELLMKKLIKFRLRGFGHTLTLLEFACCLGLYHAAMLSEDGFEVYFKGGLLIDENFNARGYWLSIISKEDIHLSRSATSSIRSPIFKVLNKMITYGLYPRTVGYDKLEGMMDEEKRSWKSEGNAPVYCQSLDATTLRELIGSNGRLVADDLAPGVLCVAMPRPPRPTIQDLYDRMGNMEILQV
ncbi:ribonuclease H-like domain-containing protein [Tanacetum coccineum]|uniref:Ribonuclease H-like domain-containing protein n=1 Tax=Tanacetum coccineum TaxID=301880 RepID=A0ABQ5I8I9_9ASTR